MINVLVGGIAVFIVISVVYYQCSKKQTKGCGGGCAGCGNHNCSQKKENTNFDRH